MFSWARWGVGEGSYCQVPSRPACWEGRARMVLSGEERGAWRSWRRFLLVSVGGSGGLLAEELLPTKEKCYSLSSGLVKEAKFPEAKRVLLSPPLGAHVRRLPSRLAFRVGQWHGPITLRRPLMTFQVPFPPKWGLLSCETGPSAAVLSEPLVSCWFPCPPEEISGILPCRPRLPLPVARVVSCSGVFYVARRETNRCLLLDGI